MLILMQDRRAVCAERTIGSEIMMHLIDILGEWVKWNSFWSIWRQF
jgi:hypothetical protein